MGPGTARDGFSAPGTVRTWQQHGDGPVTVWARRDTLAAQDLERVTERGEDVWRRATELLDLTLEMPRPVLVVLDHDFEDDESLLRETEPPLTERSLRRIELVYRSDAPGRGLERALVKRVLALGFGTRAGQATALVDGVTGLLARLEGEGDGRADSSPDDLMALRDVLDGLDRGESRGLYFETATRFVSFLVTRFGKERFRAYAEAFDPRAADAAAALAYDLTSDQLEAAFRASLEEAEEELPRAGARELASSLFALLRPHAAKCALILGTLVFDLALTTAIPMSFKVLIDDAIVPHDGRLLVRMILALVALAVVSSASGVGRDYLYAFIGARVIGDLREKMFARLQELPSAFYARVMSGDVLSRFSGDLGAVEGIVVNAVPIAVLATLNIIVSVALLFVLEWRLAMIALVGLPLGLLAPRWLGSSASVASYARKRDEGRAMGDVAEALGAQAVIKAFGLHALVRGKFRERVQSLVASTRKVGLLAALVERTAEIAIVALNLAVLGFGGYLAFVGSLSVGALVAFHALFQNLSAWLSSFVFVAPQIFQASGSLARVQELLAEPIQEDGPYAQPIGRLANSISFDDVTFAYAPGEEALRHATFDVKKGQHVAFVGPSGSGKSTVLSLLIRFYEATEGAIRIDGRDLPLVTLASWREQLGVVFQDTFLFDATIRENIRLGRPTASNGEIEGAARAAEIHDFIASLPKGYDTLVGERGGRLSGGQRQRIAIARALVRDPAVLLLDEATSALDPGAEAAINATLDKASRGRTVLSVTHRLASVTEADRIFVLDRGVVREQGTHAELLHAAGLYKHLWDKQSGFTVDEEGWRAYVKPARLRSVEILQPLSDEALETIAGRFVTEIHAAGRTLFQAGDRGDKFYILVRGAVDVLVPGASGGLSRLRRLEDGDYFGEMALLRDAVRCATIKTAEPCLLLALAREPFLELVEVHRALREAFDAAAREPPP